MAHELSIDILRNIRQAGGLNRAEIARGLGISLSLVSKVTTGLLNLGLIEERDSPDPNNGRPANRLAIHPTAGYCIGLDVGSDLNVAVITNLAGEIIASLEEPSPDQDFSLGLIQSMIERILSESGLQPEQVLGLGVGICNIVDSVSGITYSFIKPYFYDGTLPAMNIPIRDQLDARMSFPHILVDDIVRALGTAEVHYGLAAGESNFVYLLVNTGIGMAIMVNGTPFIGASHIAGEIAHIPVGCQDIQCNCGNSGCLNMVAGISAVLRDVNKRLADSPVRSSLRLLKEITIQDVIEAGERGDKLAVQALIDAGEYMGMGLAVILNLFGPRLVISGGTLAKSSVYHEAAARLMRLRALEMAARGVDLKLSSLDHQGGALGAATLAINALFEPGKKDLVHLKEK